MLDKNYEFVVMRSQAQWGLDEAKKLKPQSQPGITPRRLVRRNIDRPMLAALLERWPARYSTADPTTNDRSLFRSLNMANAAARLLANAEGTEYDIGRSLSLWVSAFEILVHDGYSYASYVYDNFDEAQWNLTKCNEAIYEISSGKPKRNLACWIYSKLNKSRNDFLHGNEITDKTHHRQRLQRHRQMEREDSYLIAHRLRSERCRQSAPLWERIRQASEPLYDWLLAARLIVEQSYSRKGERY
jgi:hypothetical protein